MASRGKMIEPAPEDRALSPYVETPLPQDGSSTDRAAGLARSEPGDAPLVVVPDETDANDNRVGTTKLILFGFFVILLFFGGGFLWAGLAPLSSAAIAPGVVSVAGNRKTVQHLDGGIVRAIHTQEGDGVAAKQMLIQLDDTEARTTLELLRAQYAAAAAQEARLRAEMGDEATIVFPTDLVAQTEDETIQQIFQGQRDVFESRRATLDNQADLMAQRVVQQKLEIGGLESQIVANRKQLDLIKQELKTVETLVAKGLATRTRLFGLQREEAGLEASIVAQETQIAVTNGAIQEVKSQVADLYAARYEQAAAEMGKVQDKLIELRELLPAAESTLQRTTIRAPIGGRVVNLQVHTIGGVIGPGAPILDIVPDDDRLVIEARLDPKDRDVVDSGMPAEVRFTAFNQRNSKPVKGRVVWISADRLADERSGVPHYLARIELVEDPAGALNGASVYPGMQANVMIVTGQRTALSYLFRPLTRTFTGAFREE